MSVAAETRRAVRSCRASAPFLPRSQFMPNESWVSVDQVAQHLDVAKDSVYRWIERRSLPAHRIGRLWKFKLSEIDDWVRARGKGPDAEGESPKTERGN